MDKLLNFISQNIIIITTVLAVLIGTAGAIIEQRPSKGYRKDMKDAENSKE